MPFIEKYLGALRVGGVVAAALALFAAGWQVNGWRLDATIADLKAEHASDIAKQSQDALKELADASKKVKDSADTANVEVSALNAKLDVIHREFKNAKPAPLPSDCKLDDVRLRNISAAVATLNETITRLKSSAALQATESP